MNIVILFEQAPSSPNAKEPLDLGLIFAAFDHQVELIFKGAGLLHLSSGINGEALGIKGLAKFIAGLEFYDIENIYFCENSRLALNLDKEQLVSNASALDYATIQQKIDKSDLSFSF